MSRAKARCRQMLTEMIHHGMAKTAQLAVSRGPAESLAGTNITVNSVLPGPTKSRGVGDFVEGMARSSDKSFEQVEAEFFDHIRPTSLTKRFASPQEVAFLVVHVQVHSLRRPWGWPFASTAASSRAPSEGLPGPSVRSLLRTRAFEFVRYSQRCLRAARPAHMKKRHPPGARQTIRACLHPRSHRHAGRAGGSDRAAARVVHRRRRFPRVLALPRGPSRAPHGRGVIVLAGIAAISL